MNRTRVAIAVILTSLLSLTCIHQGYDPDANLRYTGDDPAQREMFAYERAPVAVEPGEPEVKDGFTVTRITYDGYFRPGEADSRVVCHVYRRPGNTPKPGIVVIPILGGDYEVSTMIAEHLAGRGYNVLRFERKDRFLAPGTTLEDQNRVLREAVIDLRRGLDWWTAQPGVDPERLGLVGVSAGGMTGTLLMAHDQRIKAGVLVITGGSLADQSARVKEIEVIDFREPLMKENGWDLETYREQAHRWFDPIDPVAHAHRIDPSRVLMISGVFDRVVPYSASDRLYQAMGKPHRILIPTGHYSSVVYLGVVFIEMDGHFKRLLGDPR